MPAQSVDPTVAMLHGTSSDGPADQLHSGNFLYQAATVLAILLFLVSFWSC